MKINKWLRNILNFGKDGFHLANNKFTVGKVYFDNLGDKRVGLASVVIKHIILFWLWRNFLVCRPTIFINNCRQQRGVL